MSRSSPDFTLGRIERLYEAFNARDIDAVIAELADDVVWANGMEGGYVHGHAGVRAYWTHQFELIQPTVNPERLEMTDDGRVLADVHQVVRSVDGSETLADRRVRHHFTITDGLITRFDIDS